MEIPHKFDDIRPFMPEELPQVFDRLLANEQFCSVLAYLYPGIPVEAIAAKMKQCTDNLSFQKAFCYSFLHDLLKKVSLGCSADFSNVDLNNRYTFISNHRDIVLDSALLDVMLVDSGCDTTCEIAIGDNLLSLPWVKDLVRVNKSFIVKRGLSMREMLMASKLLSEYMHFAINDKNDNIWIAQREGRAKDSNDRTQDAILKMMTMAGEGSAVDRLLNLHLVTLAISYEFDPCDFLKAQEFQLKRDISGWKKSAHDDVVSMQTGIMGYKGHIHYHAAPCIDTWLKSLPTDTPKTEIYRIIAEHIDHEIHSHYKLYPVNFVALDMLQGTEAHAAEYTAEDKTRFEKYLAGQLAKIQIENKDEAFLTDCILRMYANPAINKLATI